MQHPETISVFPLGNVLLLPRAQLPLQIFEPRYLAMVDHALATNRMIGMIQPQKGEVDGEDQTCLVERVGCMGKITQFEDLGKDRYFIVLTGVARFEVVEELTSITPYRVVRVHPERFLSDHQSDETAKKIERSAFLAIIQAYSEFKQMNMDWEAINATGMEELVNAFSMASPYGMSEKQALLEAETVEARADILAALAEVEMARGANSDTKLQ